MNAAAYYRVSSKAQTLDMQRAAVERAAGARGDAIDRVYQEKKSAKTMVREELERLRADARAGLLQRLYVFRLDRLSRTGIRDTFELIEELRGAGVELITVTDGFSLDGPAAEVILAVMSWAAKMERLAINERIAAARDRLAAEGRAWGRPQREPEKANRARELAAKGRSVRAISIALKVPKSTVGNWIKGVSQKDGAKKRPTTRRKGGRQPGTDRK